MGLFQTSSSSSSSSSSSGRGPKGGRLWPWPWPFSLVGLKPACVLCLAAALLALTSLLLLSGSSGLATALYWRMQDVPYILYYNVLAPPDTSKTLRVPKHIYQTWYTRHLHPSVEHKLTRLRLANPHYTYTLFTDEEMHKYVRDNFEADIATAYQRLTIVTSQADFWRYLLLYKEGGVYLDMDGAVVGSLDDLIGASDEAVVSEEIHRPFFIQWALVFRPGHPILKRTIELVTRNIRRNTARSVHALTGPTVFSEAIHSLYYANYQAHFNHSLIPDVGFTDNTYHVYDNSSAVNSTFRLVGWAQTFQRYFRYKQYTEELFRSETSAPTKVHWRKQELTTALVANLSAPVPFSAAAGGAAAAGAAGAGAGAGAAAGLDSQ